jgi:hypothetical protein
MQKLFIYLLLLNFITTLLVGYVIYEDNFNKKAVVVEIESPIRGDVDKLIAIDKEFKKHTYEGMARLLYGQNIINLRLIALHHYAKPHDGEFIEGCPECEIEKQKALQEKSDSITLKTL